MMYVVTGRNKAGIQETIVIEATGRHDAIMIGRGKGLLLFDVKAIDYPDSSPEPKIMGSHHDDIKVSDNTTSHEADPVNHQEYAQMSPRSIAAGATYPTLPTPLLKSDTGWGGSPLIGVWVIYGIACLVLWLWVNAKLDTPPITRQFSRTWNRYHLQSRLMLAQPPVGQWRIRP